jgi:prepilin-type N-terminal cleavage/methylation domain-containing protein/prepilin-type processing-associated H-X9-DG protein
MAFGKLARRRRAFTLVELLVVISIIGMLMALLLPAVQQAREAGRRNTCNNNMRNCALAVTNFAGAKGTYPGYCDQLSVTATAGGTILTEGAPPVTYPVSWVTMILPYLERTDIYNVYRNQTQWAIAGGINNNPPQIYMDVLNCPSSPPPGTQGTAWCVYVANSGMVDAVSVGTASTPSSIPVDSQANGVFFNRYGNGYINLPSGAPVPYAGQSALVNNAYCAITSISQDYITLHDGSSLTFMLSENNNIPNVGNSSGGGNSTTWGPSSTLYVSGPSNNPGNWGNISAGTEPQNCFVFWPTDTPHPLMKINAPFSATTVSSPYTANLDYTAHPSSNHPTIVNTAFCDGHTRTISQDIDYNVFCLLMTPYGQQCNTPGFAPGVYDDATNNGSGTTSFYYPSPGKDNYQLLRFKPVEEAQIN